MKDNLFQILLDPKIEKIIHSCDNDVKWILDEFGILVKNIFDTQHIFQYIIQIKKKSGLNHLINKYFNLDLDSQIKKKFQKSNWKQRPLNLEQLDYAAMDAFYLIHLRNLIKNEINLNEEAYNNFMLNFQEKIEKKLSNPNMKERNDQKVINYLISNLTKCDLEELNKMKEMSLQFLIK